MPVVQGKSHPQPAAPDTQQQQRGRGSPSAGEGSRNVTDISLYSCVAMGILEKAVTILYSKPHIKSRREQYHLFAAYNFLFQAVLNSSVWGEGINNILYSHVKIS